MVAATVQGTKIWHDVKVCKQIPYTMVTRHGQPFSWAHSRVYAAYRARAGTCLAVHRGAN
jgi:hypothetical protein